ncbi:DUF3536 domain-containing protein [Candidatus Woesearchaeota archaeon]|nr:DUF3536 domain-containing protein [Candidatus Woesearchaeota archaeon]
MLQQVLDLKTLWPDTTGDELVEKVEALFTGETLDRTEIHLALGLPPSFDALSEIYRQWTGKPADPVIESAQADIVLAAKEYYNDRRIRHPLQLYAFLVGLLGGLPPRQAALLARMRTHRITRGSIGIDDILRKWGVTGFKGTSIQGYDGGPACSMLKHYHQPVGFMRGPINDIIYAKSLLPCILSQSMVLTSNNISPSLMLDLLERRYIHPGTHRQQLLDNITQGLRRTDKQARAKYGVTNFTVQPIFHPIMPLLPDKSQRLQMLWGEAVHHYFFTGEILEDHEAYRKSRLVFLPEMAYTHQTLELIAELGYRGTILPGTSTNVDISLPYRIETAKGDLKVFFRDEELSIDIAFHQAERFHRIMGNRALGNAQRPHYTTCSMDGETFGYHNVHGVALLSRLLREDIPGSQRAAVPLQAVMHSLHEDQWEQIALDDINPSGSWSCQCETTLTNLLAAKIPEELKQYILSLGLANDISRLVRWFHPCKDAGTSDFDPLRWKIPLRAGLRNALVGLHELYTEATKGLLKNSDDALAEYINIKLRAIDGTIKKAHIDNFIDEHFRDRVPRHPELFRFVVTLMEGIYHAEAAQTSCATFWDKYCGLEPQYCVVHMSNAIALFKKVLRGRQLLGTVETEFEAALNNTYDSRTSKTPSAAQLYRDVVESYDDADSIDIRPGKGPTLRFSYDWGKEELEFSPREHMHLGVILEAYGIRRLG